MAALGAIGFGYAVDNAARQTVITNKKDTLIDGGNSGQDVVPAVDNIVVFPGGANYAYDPGISNRATQLLGGATYGQTIAAFANTSTTQLDPLKARQLTITPQSSVFTTPQNDYTRPIPTYIGGISNLEALAKDITYSISGTVTDPSSVAVSGAKVMLFYLPMVPYNGGFVTSTTTDGSGNYAFTGLVNDASAYAVVAIDPTATENLGRLAYMTAG